MATLLPNGEQTFVDANGVPLASGLVYMYVPNTTTPKDSWQDANELVLNTNPITLDAAGRAIIYGSGSYRQQVFDSAGNLIWDQLTASTDSGAIAFGGTSSGSANAQTIAASSFSSTDGQVVVFIAGLTNTSALTITPSGGTAIPVLKDVVSGPTPCTGNEVVTGNAVQMIYDAGRGAFHLVEYPITPGNGALTNIAGGTTIDLGTIVSRNANVTGSGWTCSSFGGTASASAPIYYLTFAATGTLTYNATSMILPGGASISVRPGDTAIAMYLGSSNWRVIDYTQASKPVGTAPGALSGCTITNNSTTAIDFGSGTAADSTNAFYMVNASTLTKILGTAWAVGNSQGGLFSGAVADGTYHCFIIMRPDTGVVDAGFDTSVTAANRPTAYTYFRRVGSIIRSGGSILAFTQTGNTFTLTTVASTQATNPGISAVTNTLTVPTGLVLLANIYAGLQESGQPPNNYMLVTALSQTDTTPSTTNYTVGTAGAAAVVDAATNGSFIQIITNTSAQIRTRVASSGSNTRVNVTTVGWVDTRGLWG